MDLFIEDGLKLNVYSFELDKERSQQFRMKEMEKINPNYRVFKADIVFYENKEENIFYTGGPLSLDELKRKDYTVFSSELDRDFISYKKTILGYMRKLVAYHKLEEEYPTINDDICNKFCSGFYDNSTIVKVINDDKTGKEKLKHLKYLCVPQTTYENIDNEISRISPVINIPESICILLKLLQKDFSEISKYDTDYISEQLQLFKYVDKASVSIDINTLDKLENYDFIGGINRSAVNGKTLYSNAKILKKIKEVNKL